MGLGGGWLTYNGAGGGRGGGYYLVAFVFFFYFTCGFVVSSLMCSVPLFFLSFLCLCSL